MDAPLGDESGFELEGEGGRNIWQFPYMAPLIAKRHMVLPSTRLFCFRGGGNKELEIPLEYERRLKKHHHLLFEKEAEKLYNLGEEQRKVSRVWCGVRGTPSE